MLNRTLIIVKAKQPLLDWYRSLPDSEDENTTLEDLNHDATAYLLPEADYEDEIEELLQHYYPDIFADELLSWWTKEDDWPEDRPYEMFKEWFHVEYHTEIRDKVGEPFVDDDMDYE
jgi:hypothetical protein